MIDVVRKNCSVDTQTEFKFKAAAIAYLVKNFTSAPALVCLDKWDEAQAVMVAANCAESIASNPDPAHNSVRSTTKVVIVQVQQEGTVEVIRDD